MTNGSISESEGVCQPPLTHRKPMTSQEFWGRVANNHEVRVENQPGEIIVYRGEKRVARWLPYPQILHYIPEEPQDNGISTDDEGRVTITPPTCPECEIQQMVLYRRVADRSFFFGCPGYWGPRKCEGTIDIVPASLAELIALNEHLAGAHAEQVSQGQRKRRSRIFAADFRRVSDGI